MRPTITDLCAALAAASLAACGSDREDDLAPGAEANRYPDGANVASEGEPLSASGDGRRPDAAPGSMVARIAGEPAGDAHRPAGMASSSLAVATTEAGGEYLDTSAGSALYYV